MLFKSKNSVSGKVVAGSPAPESTLGTDEAPVFTRIEAFVAELMLCLPAVRSAETSEEIRQHLIAAATARMQMGATIEVAEAETLKRFGTIRTQRAALRRELLRTIRSSERKAAFWFALASFGTVCAFDLAGIMFFSDVPDIDGYHWVLEGWQWYAIFWLLIGSPLVTGWWVGRQTGVLAIRTVLRAQAVIMNALLLISGTIYVASYAIDYFGHGGPHLINSAEELAQRISILIFGFAVYHAIRIPLSLLAAWLSDRKARKPLLGEKG